MSGFHASMSPSISTDLSVWLPPIREELSRTLLTAPCGAIVNSVFFLAYFDRMLDLAAGDAETARAALAARGLHTYTDLVTRHAQLLEYLARMDEAPSAGCGTVSGLVSGMEASGGEGQLFLNVLDFLLAIPHVPQPDDPAATTVLGYYLSAIQSVLCMGTLSRWSTSLSQFMRLPVAAGLVLAQASRTRTGQPVTALYSSPRAAAAPAPVPAVPGLPAPGTGQSGFVSFESLQVTNAVAFSPELVWLTGYLLPSGNTVALDGPVPVQLWYGLQAPERGEFFVSAEVAREVIRGAPPPDFFRAMYDAVCR